ncbi:acetylxylan esterase [Vibrio sp. WXL210]|uniref:acetylxylan esterase n=1 Tax=Vibrio sp. WXL210 TaxID=3450709 RepID=UPI003EC696FD
MSKIIDHDFPFEPDYGYDLKRLQSVPSGIEPSGFEDFWQQKYQEAAQVSTHLSLQDSGVTTQRWRVFNCYYDSTEGVRIGGWLLLPLCGGVEAAVIYGHGYGGLHAPDTSWALDNTAILMPCIRGISRSRYPGVSDDPYWHVLHHIQDPHQYIIGGCVQDIWCGISALLTLFPGIEQAIGYAGDSFGGGLGVIATAFDLRITRGHFHVPTFGNTQLRLTMPTVGSTQALIDFKDKALLAKTLPYFDTSVAARYLTQPTHWGLALFDPFVAPPGQFSAFNACLSPKKLTVLDAGHFDYQGKVQQLRAMKQNVHRFFNQLRIKDAS